MNLTPEQRETGKQNFYEAMGSNPNRRDVLKGMIAGGVAVSLTAIAREPRRAIRVACMEPIGGDRSQPSPSSRPRMAAARDSVRPTATSPP